MFIRYMICDYCYLWMWIVSQAPPPHLIDYKYCCLANNILYYKLYYIIRIRKYNDGWYCIIKSKQKKKPKTKRYPRRNAFFCWNMAAGVGLMMDSEKEILEAVEAKTAMTNYWIPLTWATNIINRARREKLISNDHMVQTILLEMSDMRYRLGSLIGYDNVNIPILYSQVGIHYIQNNVHNLLYKLQIIIMYYINC